MEHANIAELQAQADQVAFISSRKVSAISGYSKSAIARKVKAGKFPAPVIREGNCVRWDLAEVLKWRAEQFSKREERRKAEAAGAEALAA